MTVKKPFKLHSNLDPLTNKISGEIVDAAYKVHFALGPGLLESVYEACLVYKIIQKGLKVEKQVGLPIHFEGVRLDAGLRLDLLVEKRSLLN